MKEMMPPLIEAAVKSICHSEDEGTEVKVKLSNELLFPTEGTFCFLSCFGHWPLTEEMVVSDEQDHPVLSQDFCVTFDLHRLIPGFLRR